MSEKGSLSLGSSMADWIGNSFWTFVICENKPLTKGVLSLPFHYLKHECIKNILVSYIVLGEIYFNSYEDMENYIQMWYRWQFASVFF